MKKLITVLVLGIFFSSCNKTDDGLVEKIAAEKVENKTEVLTAEVPELSIYNLPSTWTTQDSKDIELEDLRGKVLVMVMIYTECKAACPRLVADMRNIENKIPKEDLDKVRFIMVSIDPETDTPEHLKEFSKENLMEEKHWMFLRSTPEATREFAAVLAVSYKRISPIDFTHSNIISVFDTEGVLVHQQEGLGVDNKETIEAIHKEIIK
ncbi:SCO family protein [Antarcticibacterium sp. 1MA-6-2]|uniref:SCO family protein n=1 Tax=Antarcticibacterium sp. 1MA-6-2 TaxID=2908210 RepID=UPI001F1C73DC|nr:SCO family protein [Antarcticibacterium sp. 1MA-6-2]UJH90843.1 SCO family protein [Antarcticibacterium sp. 1MA-6-2]